MAMPWHCHGIVMTMRCGIIWGMALSWNCHGMVMATRRALCCYVCLLIVLLLGLPIVSHHWSRLWYQSLYSLGHKCNGARGQHKKCYTPSRFILACTTTRTTVMQLLHAPMLSDKPEPCFVCLLYLMFFI